MSLRGTSSGMVSCAIGAPLGRSTAQYPHNGLAASNFCRWMTIDNEGRLFIATGGGVEVLSEQGQHLGTIPVGARRPIARTSRLPARQRHPYMSRAPGRSRNWKPLPADSQAGKVKLSGRRRVLLHRLHHPMARRSDTVNRRQFISIAVAGTAMWWCFPRPGRPRQPGQPDHSTADACGSLVVPRRRS